MNIGFFPNFGQRACSFLPRPVLRSTRCSSLFQVTFKRSSQLHVENTSKPLHEWHIKMENKVSTAYQKLCTEYYEIDKPEGPKEGVAYYLQQAVQAKSPILEPMCGTGRFLIPIAKAGLDITGFDLSSHMLNVCKEKCKQAKLQAKISKDSFETFSPPTLFGLIFIPTSSFCLLTDPAQASFALKKIHSWLAPTGKFIVEVDTILCKSHPEGIWKGSWVGKSDGSRVVLNTMANFDKQSKIDQVLCRYELWEKNKITKTEVEDFRVRLYDLEEIESLLQSHKFKVVKKLVPYTLESPDQNSESVVYECLKL